MPKANQIKKTFHEVTNQLVKQKLTLQNGDLESNHTKHKQVSRGINGDHKLVDFDKTDNYKCSNQHAEWVTPLPTLQQKGSDVKFLNLKDHHVSNALNLKHSEYNWTILESSVENCLKSLGKLNNSELKQIGESIKPKGIYAGVEELKKISNENKSHDKYSELFDDDANKNMFLMHSTLNIQNIIGLYWSHHELKQIGESIKPKGIYAGVEELKKISNENKSHDKYSELFDDDANKNNTVRDISISGFDSRIVCLASLCLEGSKQPTLHLVIPWYKALLDHCQVITSDNEITKKIKLVVAEKLIEKIKIHELHKLAIFFNPLMKKLKILESGDSTW
ncbi:15047_t:CDS:2, partial [Entrophospora sp. SA101]